MAEERAAGLLARIYAGARARAGRIANIIRTMSLNPATCDASMGLYVAIMHRPSPLTRRQREMLAVVVSRANDCHY